MERYRGSEKKKKQFFADLEKKLMLECQGKRYDMRKSGVAETYIRVVQDMYERSKTVVRFAIGMTKGFKAELGLLEGSALSRFCLQW